MPPSHAIGVFISPQRSELMKPDKSPDDASFPGSMESAGPSADCTALRAQAELVEALARLVLDSVAKADDGERPGEQRPQTQRA